LRRDDVAAFLSRAIRIRTLAQLSLFRFTLLRLTLLGFHGGFPDHLAIPDAAY
jgi:hypothetical protein